MPQSTKPCEVAGAEEASDDILFLTNVATYCVKKDALITKRVGSCRNSIVVARVLSGLLSSLKNTLYSLDCSAIWTTALVEDYVVVYQQQYCIHQKLLKTTSAIDYSFD